MVGYTRPLDIQLCLAKHQDLAGSMNRAHLQIWSVMSLTCVPPFNVQMEFTKLTCSNVLTHCSIMNTPKSQYCTYTWHQAPQSGTDSIWPPVAYAKACSLSGTGCVTHAAEVERCTCCQCVHAPHRIAVVARHMHHTCWCWPSVGLMMTSHLSPTFSCTRGAPVSLGPRYRLT